MSGMRTSKGRELKASSVPPSEADMRKAFRMLKEDGDVSQGYEM